MSFPFHKRLTIKNHRPIGHGHWAVSVCAFSCSAVLVPVFCRVGQLFRYRYSIDGTMDDQNSKTKSAHVGGKFFLQYSTKYDIIRTVQKPGHSPGRWARDTGTKWTVADPLLETIPLRTSSKGGGGMVTYAELFTYTLVIIAVITLVLDIIDKRK